MVKQLTNFTKVKWGEGNYMDREERVTRFASPEGNAWACKAAKEITFYASLDFRLWIYVNVMLIHAGLSLSWQSSCILFSVGCTQESTVIVKEVKHMQIWQNRPKTIQYADKEDHLQFFISVVYIKCDCQTNSVSLSPKFPPSQDQASSLRVLCSSIIKRAPFPIQSVTIATRPWPSATCRPPSPRAVVRWEEPYIAIIRWGFISF